MTDYLRKYDPSTGKSGVIHPSNDPIRARSIIFKESVELDETNIALKSEVDAVSSTVTSVISALNAHEYQNNVKFGELDSDILSLYNLVRYANENIDRIYGDTPKEERVELTAGQTIVQFSQISFSADNSIPDLEVTRNGIDLFGDQSGGVNHDYRKLDGTRIELTRPAELGDRIYGRMSRNLLNTQPVGYFYEYLSGVEGRGVPVPQRYSISSDRLTVFRNGVLLNKTASIGEDVTQYEETNQFQITLGNQGSDFEVNLASDEVMAFWHKTLIPNYRVILTGQTGASLTVPSYTVGSDQLLVWRNGVLMNTSGYGTSSDQYTEGSSTTITLNEAAVVDDVFTIEFINPIQWRQDITGVTTSVINLSNPYTIGTDRLLVFRNGKLIYRSLSLGTIDERYSHTTTTSITLEQAATGDEVFSVIYL